MVSKEDVKHARKFLQLSQVNFGRLLGVTGQTVFRWEKGTRKVRGPAKMMIRDMLANKAKG